MIVLGGGWHELLPERVFNFPRLGCINTHPSLLPEFRGTSSTRWQIKNSMPYSGSTIHYVNNKFDEGEVLTQKKIFLGENYNDAPQQLFYKLGEVGADIMIPLLKRIQKDDIPTPFKAHHNLQFYNYYKKWKWDFNELKIKWTYSLREIHFYVLSCSQEHYKYLGPHFKFHGTTYFLRKTILHKSNGSDQSEMKKGHLYIIALENKNIGLTRKGEDYVLELCRVQKYSESGIKRAFNPRRLMQSKINKIFTNLHLAKNMIIFSINLHKTHLFCFF